MARHQTTPIAFPWDLPCLALFALLPAMYLPALTNIYAFSDDYNILDAEGFQGGLNRMSTYSELGRPLQGLLEALMGAMAGSVENLVYFRGVGVLLLIGLALCFFCLLRHRGATPWAAAGFSVLLAGLPSWQLVAGWAQLFMAPITALCAYGAFVTIHNMAAKQPIGSRWESLARFFGAFTLLVVGGLIYQSYLLIYFAFVALVYWPLSKLTRRDLVSLLTHATVMLAALVLLYAYNKSIGNPRAVTDHDVVGKAVWLVQQPLTNALNPYIVRWTVPQDHAFYVRAGIVLGAMLLIAFFKTQGKWKYRLFSAALIPVLMLGSHGVFLIIQERWASYRSLFALATTTLTLILILYQTCRPKEGSWRLKAWNSVLILSVLTTAVVSHRNLLIHLARPQAQEFLYVQSRTFPALRDGVRNFYIEMANWSDSPDGCATYDEFGNPSGAVPGAPRSMFNLVAHGKHIAQALHDSDVVVGTRPANAEEAAQRTIIDMATFGKQRNDAAIACR